MSTDPRIAQIHGLDAQGRAGREDEDVFMADANCKQPYKPTDHALAFSPASLSHALPQAAVHCHSGGDSTSIATKRADLDGVFSPPPKRVASPKKVLPTRTPDIVRMYEPAVSEPTILPKTPPPKPSPTESPPKYAREPISQSITQQQLAAEVKAIYHALVQIEARCVQLVSQKFAALQDKDSDNIAPLRIEEWRTLMSEHRKLLHEHHDFFLASQHPSSSPQLREIATKYSMPARMWKHGIHNFLELLRRHLPHSIEWMLAFIYLAYQMMALLYETIPAYEETWIECLGDLARYRMAIEDEDPRDRDNFTAVAGFWYCKAVDKNFHVGRLYHHKAILARADAVQQLSLYARSLTARAPFASTMTSILTLLEPFLARPDLDGSLTNDVYIVQSHACIFLERPQAEFEHPSSLFQATLSATITRLSAKWRDQGCYLLIANIAALCGWGKKTSLRDDLEARPGSEQAPSKAAPSNQTINVTAFSATSQQMAYTMMTTTLSIVANTHHNDKNILAFGHVLLTFTYSVASLKTGPQHLQKWLNWKGVCKILNSAYLARSKKESLPPEAFDPRMPGNKQPINEDYLVRGQIWAPPYLDKEFFATSNADQDERKVETSKVTKTRLDRIAWLGVEIAAMEGKEGPWLRFDRTNGQFSIR